MTDAADTLRALLSAQGESVRLGAARSILELPLRLREAEELEQRVRDLEGRLDAGEELSFEVEQAALQGMLLTEAQARRTGPFGAEEEAEQGVPPPGWERDRVPEIATDRWQAVDKWEQQFLSEKAPLVEKAEEGLLP